MARACQTEQSRHGNPKCYAGKILARSSQRVNHKSSLKIFYPCTERETAKARKSLGEKGTIGANLRKSSFGIYFSFLMFPD